MLFRLVPRRSLLNSAGFSMIELMIAAGLMGVVAMGTMSLNKMGFVGQKSIQAKDDARTITNEIATVLTDPDACMATFGGLNPVNGVSIAQIRNRNGTPQFTVGQRYGNNTLILANMFLGGPGTDAKTNINRWVPANNNKGTAFLAVNWTQTGGGAAKMISGPADMNRYVLVSATLDGANNITQCVGVVANVSSSGTGNAGYIPVWLTSTNLGNSVMFQNGSSIGVNTTGPSQTFEVAGTAYVSGDTTIGGSHTVNGNQSVAGNQNVGGSANVTGNIGVGGSSTVNGNQNVGGYQNVGSNQNVGGTLGVTGNATLSANATVGGSFRGNSDGYFAGNVGLGMAPTTKLEINGGFVSRVGGGVGYFGFGPFSGATTNDVDIQYSGGSDSNFYFAHNGANNGATNFVYQGPGAGGGIRNLVSFMNSGDLLLGSSGDGSRGWANQWTTYSDRTLKTHIEPLQNSLESLLKLRGVSYEWIKDKAHQSHIGLIAQEVQEVFPALVSKNKFGKLGVGYEELIPVLIESLKTEHSLVLEQRQQIDALAKRLSALESKH